MGHALGIDVGTTNAKVALVSEDGELLAAATRPIRLHRDGDVAEQDANQLWSAVCDGVRAVVAEAGARKVADLEAIGVCSQYSSIVPVDEAADPLAPLVVYLDQRGSHHAVEIMRRHPDAFELWLDRHGLPPIGGGLSLGHLLHLQLDRPEVHEATAAYLEPMDFVTARLTGAITATQCSMFAAQLCDNRTLGVTTYDEELVSRSGVDARTLPPLVDAGAAVGAVLPKVADELGIPETAVVRAGMNDSHAGALATGAGVMGRAGVMVGTTAVVLDTIGRKELDLDHGLVSLPSPVPDTWLVWAENGIAGQAVERVMTQLLFVGDPDPFASLDPALESSPPGANGALFLPWLTGSLAPRLDGDVRGGFVNLGLDTSRADLVRAAVEGTTHNVRWLLPHVEAFTGTPLTELVFAGGAARSSGWARVLADVTGRLVTVVDDPGTAVARAVGLAALLGPHDDGGLVRCRARYEPSTDAADRYATMHESFVAAHDALRPLSAAINERTSR